MRAILSSVNLLAVFIAAIVGTLTGFLWDSDLLFVKSGWGYPKYQKSKWKIQTWQSLLAPGGGGITGAPSFCLALACHFCSSFKEAFMALELIIYWQPLT